MAGIVNMIRGKRVLEDAFVARQVTATPETLDAYFKQVASYDVARHDGWPASDTRMAGRCAPLGWPD
jgi:hypothetical protein